LKNKKRDNFSEDIFRELEISNLTELYKRSCRDLNEYKELVATAKIDETKFDKQKQWNHMDHLKLRITHIEQTTENHLDRLLRGKNTRNKDQQ